jgi:hypothetical protein
MLRFEKFVREREGERAKEMIELNFEIFIKCRAPSTCETFNIFFLFQFHKRVTNYQKREEMSNIKDKREYKEKKGA